MKTLISMLLGALLCYFIMKYQDNISDALPYSVVIQKAGK